MIQDLSYKEVPMWFNKPQQRSILTLCKEEYGVWGRGTGKTQGPIAYRASHAANLMPRGATGIVGSTYMQLLDRTLPPLMKAWEKFGYREDEHYWVRKRPPAKMGVPKAIYPVLKPEHSITWFNGHVFHLISQDRPGLANGKTVDAIIADEARFINHQRYMDDIVPINRGNKEIFGHLSEHHMVTMFTDMPTDPRGQWILDKKDQMDVKTISQIINLQLELHKIEAQYAKATTEQSRQYYHRKIKEYHGVISVLRSQSVYYSEASSLDNIQILGEEQIRQWRREMLWPVFQAAILNEKIIRVENGFYYMLDTDHHCYSSVDYNYIDGLGIYLPNGVIDDCRKDGDLIKGKPIDIAMDYNASIKSLVCSQDTQDEFRILKSFFVLRQDRKILDDVVDKFCAYYKYHNTHVVNYFYDNTAQVTDATRLETLAELVIARFEHNNWKVNPVFIGQQPMHETRFRLWEAVLNEKDPRFPRVRFNNENCDALLISLQQTKTRTGQNGTEKDKRPELRSTVKPQDAPHLSDALDTLYIGKYQYTYGYAMPVTELLMSS